MFRRGDQPGGTLAAGKDQLIIPVFQFQRGVTGDIGRVAGIDVQCKKVLCGSVRHGSIVFFWIRTGHDSQLADDAGLPDGDILRQGGLPEQAEKAVREAFVLQLHRLKSETHFPGIQVFRRHDVQMGGGEGHSGPGSGAGIFLLKLGLQLFPAGRGSIVRADHDPHVRKHQPHDIVQFQLVPQREAQCGQGRFLPVAPAAERIGIGGDFESVHLSNLLFRQAESGYYGSAPPLIYTV